MEQRGRRKRTKWSPAARRRQALAAADGGVRGGRHREREGEGRRDGEQQELTRSVNTGTEGPEEAGRRAAVLGRRRAEPEKRARFARPAASQHARVDGEA